ncbi:DnaJ domain-containing protein [Cephalotus follicularis]|uniref:DnaJ domain-containing protein n=1 Tax=Cephalotus follicularis TaxID=3775 RepID=A0A1Q3BV02_CEPFO|nr:DnaJ domain-containing protein [Cephalotus follicularis]
MAAVCKSLYEILEIPVGATGQEIKAAYRRLARVYHPDVVTLKLKDSSADKFMSIHAAYSTLSDPQKRIVYDRKLFHRRDQPLAAKFSCYSGRNWETDQCL